MATYKVRTLTALPSERMDSYVAADLTDYLNQIHTKNANIGFGIAEYTHGATAVDVAYFGGVYSPTQNRIYLVPFGQADETNWHYIDCSDGSVVAYAHGLGGDIPGVNAYTGGVYSPTEDKIYLVPYGQSDELKWHYIDCSDGSVVAYAHGVTAVNVAYRGGVYSPTQNRIYLVPYGQADETNWHCIQEYSTAEIPPSLAASPLFNKF